MELHLTLTLTLTLAQVPLVKCFDMRDAVNCDVVPCAELALHNSGEPQP